MAPQRGRAGCIDTKALACLKVTRQRTQLLGTSMAQHASFGSDNALVRPSCCSIPGTKQALEYASVSKCRCVTTKSSDTKPRLNEVEVENEAELTSRFQ
jgi:hypothetical protein